MHNFKTNITFIPFCSRISGWKVRTEELRTVWNMEHQLTCAVFPAVCTRRPRTGTSGSPSPGSPRRRPPSPLSRVGGTPGWGHYLAVITIKCHLWPAQLPPVAACAGVGGGQPGVLGDHILSEPWQVKCASKPYTQVVTSNLFLNLNDIEKLSQLNFKLDNISLHHCPFLSGLLDHFEEKLPLPAKGSEGDGLPGDAAYHVHLKWNMRQYK